MGCCLSKEDDEFDDTFDSSHLDTAQAEAPLEIEVEAPYTPSEIEVLLHLRSMSGPLKGMWKDLHASMTMAEVKTLLEGLHGTFDPVSKGIRTAGSFKAGDAEYYRCQPVPVFDSVGRIVELKINGCFLAGTLPNFRACSALRELWVGSNLLQCLPSGRWWPPSLRVLSLERNSRLWGVLPKALVAQCDTIMFALCKQRHQCTAEEKHSGMWLQFPFIVGVSVVSALCVQSFPPPRVHGRSLWLPVRHASASHLPCNTM